jgi:hypothetical protein
MLRQSTGYIEEGKATAETSCGDYAEGEIMATTNKFKQKLQQTLSSFKRGGVDKAAGKLPKVKSSKQAVAIEVAKAKKANKLK